MPSKRWRMLKKNLPKTLGLQHQFHCVGKQAGKDALTVQGNPTDKAGKLFPGLVDVLNTAVALETNAASRPFKISALTNGMVAHWSGSLTALSAHAVPSRQKTVPIRKCRRPRPT